MVKSLKWLQIKIPVNSETEDAISNYLFENDSVGCYVSEHILYAYFKIHDWNHIKTKNLNNYLNELSELGFHIDLQRLEISEIEDEDWNARWKKSLKPIFILPDLIIKPTWIRFSPPENALVIEIDPQMAFGTGSHATTQLMLTLMKSYIRPNQRVLDIGTGSGILAIAAVKLYVSTVIAFDIDPVATSTAKINASLNNVSQQVHLFTGAIDCLARGAFDLILANINRQEITKLLPVIPNLLNPEGYLILSGILIDEEDLILKTLNNFNLNTLTISRKNEWLGLVVKR